jgi:predicted nucleic acid-binding protein
VGHHPHHQRTAHLVRRVLSGDDQGFVAAHGLAETYAVLTTLPVTPRIGPEAAVKLIEENLLPHFEVMTLTAREVGRLILALAGHGVIGGATYDAVQLACARKARARRIYTFNVKDFRRLDPDLADRIVAP